jgi:hypothetical protein
VPKGGLWGFCGTANLVVDKEKLRGLAGGASPPVCPAPQGRGPSHTTRRARSLIGESLAVFRGLRLPQTAASGFAGGGWKH